MKGYPFILNVCAIFLHFLGVVRGEFPNQPKIHSRDGTLVLEPAWDKNLTLRLVLDSELYFGDVNIVDEVRQLLMLRNKNGGEKNFSNGGALSVDGEVPSVETLSAQVRELKRNLVRLSRRLNTAQNRTSGVGQQRRIRRFLGRLRRAEGRVTQLELNLAMDDCKKDDANPCKNGGICYDGYKSFHCECPTGWSGETCSEDVDECYILTGTDLGCQNNGVCVNTDGSYRCVCSAGFTGTHCRVKNATCESAEAAEICGHGICVHADGQKGYSCLCDQGWTKNNVTMACIIDVDECALPTQPCHSGCENLPGSFRCQPCPRGYQGNGITCTDINECATNNGGCSLQPKVQCINTEGSYRCGSCPPGSTGDGRTCEMQPSNTCDTSNICHPRAKCEYISETVVCTCPLGLYGHGFGPDGCSVEANATDPCANHECKNNGICTVVGRGTLCICPTGFMGAQCEQADACQVHPCQNGGTCKLLPGNRFSCTCERGTTGKKCEIVREICGSVLRQESGELTYPAESDEYRPFERCAWMIRTADTKVLNVTFTKFDLEEPGKAGGECTKDWLQIHDGRALSAPLIGRFCGKQLPLGGSLQSSHQQLLFWFRSDNATHGGGFAMSWTSQAHTCGGSSELGDGDTGVIRSPGYPGKTPPNRNCEWKLMAPFGYRLVLRVYEVVLGSGSNSNCTMDALEIFDSDLLLRAICESSQPEPLHTSSNNAIVHFKTDGYLSDSAFQLHYEVVPGTPHCGGLFTEPQGIVVGFMNAPLCEYLIQQLPGMRIELEFLSLNLLDSTDCTEHKVEVFDGKTEDDPLINRLCGNEGLNEPLVSSTNFMLLRYEFLLTLPLRKEFRAKYKRTCDERFFGPEGGVFTTPNYPKPYYDYVTCTYDIYGPSSTVVHVNFTDFSISETIPTQMETIGENETIIYRNFVEVHLSNSNKRVFYKGGPMHLVSEQNRVRIVFHSAANSRRARGLRVEYDFETMGCGGVLTDNDNSFSKFGSLINMPDYCEWIIEAPTGKDVLLDLKYMRYGSKCQAGEASLFVYANSSNGDSQLLRSFNCDQDNLRESIYSSIVTIILKKPLSTPRYTTFGLFGNFNFTDNSEDCGGTFNAEYGVIRSPGWPRDYNPNSECVWHITAPMGHQIELVVRNFSIEWNGPECPSDYLEIRNGGSESSPLLGRYCGTTIPGRIPSFSNHMYLRFKSDAFIEVGGFYLTWQQTRTGCGGKLTAYTGSIHPPLDTEGDSVAVTCDWQITVAQGSIIELKLSGLDGEHSVCEKKQLLTVYDGIGSTHPLMPWHCNRTSSNKTEPFTLRSTQNRMLVRYHNTNNDVEFVLEYRTICENILSDSLVGVIESPNFPDLYPPNLACTWDIRGGRNNRISLSFSHLQLEQRSPACDEDFVEVSDMRNEVVLSKKSFCTQPLEPFESEGNRVVVKFSSDYSENRGGFRVEYKRLGCGEHLQAWYGTFSTPLEPYSVDMECDWYIEVPPGRQIILHFSDIHIETDQPDCSQDAIIVSETKNSTVLLRECSVERTSMKVATPSNRLYVHFHSSAKRTRKYFRASYVTAEAACGGILRSPGGTITTPNYPDVASNVECVWTIIVAVTHGVYVDFTDLDIPESSNCTDASIEFSTIDKVIQERSCGANLKKTIFAERTNTLIIRLKVSASGSAKFSLNYRKQCGGTITAPTGFLRATPNQNCVWNIEMENGALVTLDILRLDCPCSQSQPQCGLKVAFNLEEPDYATNLCATPQRVSNFIGEKIILEAHNINLDAKYATLENTCGGRITSLKGILMSPQHHGSYPAKMECIWEIEANSGNSIDLNFHSIDIVPSTHCNEDFLEIRDAEVGGKVLAVYCGKTTPSETLEFYQKVWLKFKSAENSIGAAGFKLSWAYSHFSEFNVTGGKLESPPLAAVRSEEEPYSWRIYAPRGSLLDVKLKSYSQGLRIFDGFDESAIELELKYSPWSFISSSNVIYVVTVNSDLEYFQITWSVITSEAVAVNATIQECQQTIILPSTGGETISSPNYPSGYKTDLSCEWLVKTADPTLHAVVRLIEIDLEEISECSADFVRVSSSSDLSNWHERLRECKLPPFSHPQKSLISGEPYLKIEFHSDMSVNRTGFTSIVYSVCGSNLTAPVGTILDSSLWLSVSDHPSCIWHIQVRPGKRIQFSFEYGATQMHSKSDHCTPYAVIYDGFDTTAPILPPGQICNHPDRNVKIVQTTSNHAVLKYNVSLVSGQNLRHFWNLTYREFSECDGEVVLTHLASWFNISSPRYPNIPQPHTECNWVIVAPPGEAVRADFIGRFDMNMRSCNKEFIEFHDGSTTLARSLGRFCRRTGTILSTQNVMHVRYLTDNAEPHTGFQLNVSIALCGGTTHAFVGEITSTRYPALGAYAKGTVCEWAIVLQDKARIRLNFTDIHLPYDAKNEVGSDRLEVVTLSENPVLLAVYYGNLTEMPLLETESNSVAIRLISVSLDNSKYRGFRLRHQRTYGNCIRQLFSDSGHVVLNRLHSGGAYQTCRWNIRVPRGQRVSLQITKLEGQSFNNGTPTNQMVGLNGPWVAISMPTFSFFNDLEMLSPIVRFNASDYNSSRVIQSTDNVMIVHILMGSSRFVIDKVEATYNSDEESPCPPDIAVDSLTGQINLPAPSFEQINFYCRSFFQLSGRETITFELEELLLQKMSSFNNQYAVRIRHEDFFVPFSVYRENVTQRLISLSPKRGSISWMQTEKSRIKRFSANYFRNPCGGTLQIADELTIDYPLINATVSGALQCVWTLRSLAGRSTYQLVGNTSFVDSCDREYIEVYGGLNTDYDKIGRFCRDNPTLNSSLLQRAYTMLLYHADEYKHKQSNFQFRVQKSIKCGSKTFVVFHSDPISIDTKTYKNNFECSWEFQASQGLMLSMTFSGRFFIEESVNCTKDYLEVLSYDEGLWRPISRFCGRELAPTYNTSSHHIMVIFRTDNATTGDGFTFSLNAHCNAILNVTEDTKTLRLPQLNMMRSSSLRCSLVFRTDSDKMITLRIRNDRQVAASDNSISSSRDSRAGCQFTSFTVTSKTDDETHTEQYCRNVDVRAKHSVSVTYTSVVVTDYFIEYDLNMCGGNITAPRIIRSVQDEATNQYIVEMSCVWHVTAPQDHSILVRFKYLEMEDHPGCIYDYFAVYKGPSIVANRLFTKLCGTLTSKAPVVVVDSNQAVLTAVSDTSNSMRGFLAYVAFVPNCNERITLSDGNSPVTLTRQFKFNESEELMCYFRVMAPEGYRVSIQLHELELNTVPCMPANCNSCNHIELLDSVRAKSASMGKYCANGRANVERLSSYEDALLKLSGTIPGEFSLEIVLKMELSACGANKTFKVQGHEALTFAYPPAGQELYPPNVHCTWQIMSDYDFMITFEYSLQDVSQVTGECIDYLNFKGSYVDRRFCGNATGYETTVQTGAASLIDVTFHSDESIESKGFTITAQNLYACNKTYTTLSNMIYYTEYSGYSGACNTEVRVPDNYVITMTIKAAYFKNANCTNSYQPLKIIDTHTNKTLKEKCHTSYDEEVIYTTTNAIRIALESYSQVRLFYYVNEKTAPLGCGGFLESLEGTFESPPYEDRNTSVCRWVITVPKPNHIRTFMSRFDMGTETNCNLDHIDIFDLPSNGAERLGRSYCGPNVRSNSYDSTTNRIAVVAHKSANFDGAGFKMNYMVQPIHSDDSDQFANIFP